MNNTPPLTHTDLALGFEDFAPNTQGWSMKNLHKDLPCVGVFLIVLPYVTLTDFLAQGI